MHQAIIEALLTLEVPISLHTYTGEEETFITFFQYEETTAFSSDDEEKATNLFYQINIFSKGDYFELVKQVKEKMKELGGNRTSEIEFFDDEAFYQRSIRFTFIKTL